MIRTIVPALAILLSISAMAQTDTKVVVVPLGGADIKGHNFSGPQLNLPQKTAEAAGFSVCHSETFNTSTTLLQTLFTKCNKAELMLACRPVGNETFQVAAHAPRSDVHVDTPGFDETHTANGSEWYYNPIDAGTRSWGFAPLGSTVDRGNCDTEDVSPGGKTTAYRMCIHLSFNSLNNGWRCGGDVSLSTNSDFERVFLHR